MCRRGSWRRPCSLSMLDQNAERAAVRSGVPLTQAQGHRGAVVEARPFAFARISSSIVKPIPTSRRYIKSW
jgi:hypothetical protein